MFTNFPYASSKKQCLDFFVFNPNFYLLNTVPEVYRVEFHILWVVTLKCAYKKIGTFLSNIL